MKQPNKVTHSTAMPPRNDRVGPPISQSKVDNIVDHLNQAEQQLDYVTTSRLAAIRHKALDQAAKTSDRPRWQQWLFPPTPFTGSVAALAVVAVFGSNIWLNQTVQTNDISTGLSAGTASLSALTTDADFSIFLASDDLDFFQSLEMLESLEDDELG